MSAVNSSGKTPMDYVSDAVIVDILRRQVMEYVAVSFVSLHCWSLVYSFEFFGIEHVLP